jgi:hypothetical protein
MGMMGQSGVTSLISTAFCCGDWICGDYICWKNVETRITEKYTVSLRPLRTTVDLRKSKSHMWQLFLKEVKYI